MSYVQKANKVTREALRRVEKLARQRLSNNKNKKVLWRGYDSSGKPIVSSNGSTLSASKIQNPGSPRGTEMQFDTADSVVKQRKLPPSDPEILFEPDAKYTSHFFVLTRNDGATVAIRVRKRYGQYSIAGATSQEQINANSNPTVLVDAVVLSFGTCTKIKNNLSSLDMDGVAKTFGSLSIDNYLKQNASFKRIANPGEVTSYYDNTLNIIDGAPQDFGWGQIFEFAGVILRPWARNTVLGYGPSSFNSISSGYTERPGQSSRHDGVVFAHNANITSLPLLSNFGNTRKFVWSRFDYETEIVSTYVSYYNYYIYLKTELFLLGFEEDLGERIDYIEDGYSKFYISHDEYITRYKFTINDVTAAEFVIRDAPNTLIIPAVVDSGYRATEYFEDLSSGPLVGRRLGSNNGVSEVIPALRLEDVSDGYGTSRDIYMYSSTAPPAPTDLNYVLKWQRVNAFTPYVGGNYYTHRYSVSESIDSLGRKVYERAYFDPPIHVPCFRWEISPGNIGDYNIIAVNDKGQWPFQGVTTTEGVASKSCDIYRSGPTVWNIHPNTFGSAFVTHMPAFIVNEYKRTAQTDEYAYSGIGASAKSFTVRDNYGENNYEQDETTSGYLRVSGTGTVSYTVSLADEIIISPLVFNGDTRIERTYTTSEDLHRYYIHAVDDRTGVITTTLNEQRFGSRSDPAIYFRPPAESVDLYGTTFWYPSIDGDFYPLDENNRPVAYEVPLMYEGLNTPRVIQSFTATSSSNDDACRVEYVREVTHVNALGSNLVEWMTSRGERIDDDRSHVHYVVRMGTLNDFRNKLYNQNEEGSNEAGSSYADLSADIDPNTYRVLKTFTVKSTDYDIGNYYPGHGPGYWLAARQPIPNGAVKSGQQRHSEVVAYFAANDFSGNQGEFGLAYCSGLELGYGSRTKYKALELGSPKVFKSFTNLDMEETFAIPKIPEDDDQHYRAYYTFHAVPWSRSLNGFFQSPQQTAGGFRRNLELS